MSVIEAVTLAVWAFVELTLRVRERFAGRGGSASDHGTRVPRVW
jgi:hypothetical protein